GLDGLRRLAEERIRRSFTPRNTSFLFEFHDDHSLLRADRARDLEWDLEVHVQRVDADVHAARTASISARARRSAPAWPSRIGSATGSRVSRAASRSCASAREPS